MSRFHRVVLIGALLPLCWLGMMVVHEFGHVLGAWLTGGMVQRVVLHPLAISRTDLSLNPRPLFVAAAGPVFGALFPLLAMLLAMVLRMPGIYLLRFFAGFCLIANGAYLGVGSFEGIGDAGDLLRCGMWEWQLGLFGAITVPLGLFLWHNQGSHFGLDKAGSKVHPIAAYVCFALLLMIVAVELVAGGE